VGGQVAEGDHGDPADDHEQGRGDAEQLRELADDDGQAQAEHEADLDPGGDEARHEAHPQQAEPDQDDPDQQGQGGRGDGVALRVAEGDRATIAAEMAAVEEVGLTISCRQVPNRP
jgi:hypothetical protein